MSKRYHYLGGINAPLQAKIVAISLRYMNAQSSNSIRVEDAAQLVNDRKILTVSKMLNQQRVPSTSYL